VWTFAVWCADNSLRTVSFRFARFSWLEQLAIRFARAQSSSEAPNSVDVSDRQIELHYFSHQPQLGSAWKRLINAAAVVP
jgi:hypothetical protein